MTLSAITARLLLTLPAALGAWLAVSLFCGLLRIRDPRLRLGLAGLGAADALLAFLGLPSLLFVVVRVVAPEPAVGRLLDPVAAPILAVWLGIAGVLVARRVLAHRRLVRSLRALCLLAPPPGEVVEEVRAAARVAGVRPPRVFLSEEGGSPFLAGDVLVLPAPRWRGLPDARRRAALLHEMAHCRGRDGPVALGLSVIGALFWFDPFLRMLLAACGREREALADRTAIRLGAHPAELLAGLRDLAVPVHGAPVAVPGLGAETPRSLRRRLGLLRRPVRRRSLAVQVLLLALLFPVTWPGGGGCRLVARPPAQAPHGRLTIGIGGAGSVALYLLRKLTKTS